MDPVAGRLLGGDQGQALIESAYRGDSSRSGWTTEADILQGQRTDPDG
ncbi:GNAT family N-acetyltransferase, partial [Streptomyces sp. NPDC001948]